MSEKRSFGLAILLVLLLLASALAQQPTGVIEGVVTDEKGAAIAGATVTITEKATGRQIVLMTNNEGYYVARSLPPGSYSIKVEQQGFTTGVIEDIVVQTGQVSNGSISLKVGNVAETVTVEGTEAQLQVDTSRQTVDGVITAQQITQMPLNGRNFLDLAALQPGVVVRDGGSIDPTKVNAYRAVTVNGSSGTGTRVQIDGIDVTDETVGTTTANLSTDAVQEFQLSRSSFDLSTSLTTSGAVNIVTRSGTNELHGSGFYFYRNEKMGARLQFLPEKVPFHRHQQGYRVSGPLSKNKLFFFSNYESTYQGEQVVTTSPDFPQLNGATSLPVRLRYTTNRLDWNINDRTRFFYKHQYNDDLSTGGTGPSPFQNVDWTIVHAIGFDITGSRLTHTIRLGYVNFNNRIQSQELNFKFPLTPQGFPFYLGVGSFQAGPNSLAPQQTYQDNKQVKYDGSYIRGDHNFRFGGEYNNILLGGFANFAGPLQVFGLFNAQTKGALPPDQQRDPLAYPFDSFQTGPNSGFFTARPAHNLPHGGRRNNRIAWYVSDSWKIRRNFTLNFGTRWEYDSGFFPPKGTPTLPILNVYGPKMGDLARFPKDAFSPQIGFAWDPWGDGRTSIRGGFYRTYEMNIFNNGLFDEFARLPPGIGPEVLTTEHVVGPDGRPIVVSAATSIPGCAAADIANGDYTCFIGHPIREVIGVIAQIHQAVQAAYSNFKFDPSKGPSVFENSAGVTFGGVFPGDYRIPYSMQFNIGIQRELARNHIISVDYVRNRGVGLPYLLVDYERRRAANTFNAAAARAQIARVIGVSPDAVNPSTIEAFINARAAAGRPVNIATFNLGTDAVFQGLTPNILRARIMSGGFTLYNGLQVLMNGRFKNPTLYIGGTPLLHSLQYTISYALSRAEATSGANRYEFITNVTNNNQINLDFGPTGLDRTHIFSAGVNMSIIGGFNLNQIWTFRTSPPQSLFVPFLDGFSSTNQLFTTDLNGDGGIGGTGARGDLLPGTQIGALGRTIKSFRELNQIITNFNQIWAGQITPAGQRLVSAGLFTVDQLRRLGAVVKPIPLVPETNPWPFENQFNLDLRIERPIRIKERIAIRPSLDIFNVFNHTALGFSNPETGATYGGLNANFGALNYDYVADPQKRGGIPELTRSIRTRAQSTRLLQIGIRVDF